MSKSAWARRRQIVYGSLLVGILGLIIIFIVFISTREVPTCFDGVRNQGETAVDKGGPCHILDERFLQKEAILWTRPFKVRDGFYNAVAYIENPNPQAGSPEVTYQFRLYDKDGILITERVGQTPLYPNKVFPVFESRMNVGNRVPVRATFDFLEPIVWKRMEDDARGLHIQNPQLTATGEAPRVDAEIHNTTLKTFRNVIIVATVFDKEGNAVNASRTLIPRLEPNAIQSIAFTWPGAFERTIAKFDIVPMVLPTR